MWIQTYTGKRFNLERPDASMVCVEDIAHALSNIARFGGHARCFYSVAVHSMNVAANVRPELRFKALLHDAAEAYIGDITRPLKRLLGEPVRQLERRIQILIEEVFALDISPAEADEIHLADSAMLYVEAYHLLKGEMRDWEKPQHPLCDMPEKVMEMNQVQFLMGDKTRVKEQFLQRFSEYSPYLHV